MENKKYEINKKVGVNEYVGTRIKELRESKGYSQEELSNKLTLTRTSISNIETGRQRLNLKNIEMLCEALECKSSDILPF